MGAQLMGAFVRQVVKRLEAVGYVAVRTDTYWAALRLEGGTWRFVENGAAGNAGPPFTGIVVQANDRRPGVAALALLLEEPQPSPASGAAEPVYPLPSLLQVLGQSWSGYEVYSYPFTGVELFRLGLAPIFFAFMEAAPHDWFRPLYGLAPEAAAPAKFRVYCVTEPVNADPCPV